MSELDDRVEELRRKILALPPTDHCGHLSMDFNGNCMTCQRDDERRADMARAWDEGAHIRAKYRDDLDIAILNPYLTTSPPPNSSTNEGEL